MEQEFVQNEDIPPFFSLSGPLLPLLVGHHLIVDPENSNFASATPAVGRVHCFWSSIWMKQVKPLTHQWNHMYTYKEPSCSKNCPVHLFRWSLKKKNTHTGQEHGSSICMKQVKPQHWGLDLEIDLQLAARYQIARSQLTFKLDIENISDHHKNFIVVGESSELWM